MNTPKFINLNEAFEQKNLLPFIFQRNYYDLIHENNIRRICTQSTSVFLNKSKDFGSIPLSENMASQNHLKMFRETYEIFKIFHFAISDILIDLPFAKAVFELKFTGIQKVNLEPDEFSGKGFFELMNINNNWYLENVIFPIEKKK